MMEPNASIPLVARRRPSLDAITGMLGDVSPVAAAGVCMMTPNGHALFLRYGPEHPNAGTWSFPGGALEAGEQPEDAARREVGEETGHLLSDDDALPMVNRNADHGADYTTFKHALAESFSPHLSEEHDDYRWAPLHDPPTPLHPGVEHLLKAGHMTSDAIDRLERVKGALDAEPRSLYVHRPLKNADALIEWAHDNGFTKTLPADDMHVTLAFSRDPMQWDDIGDHFDEVRADNPANERSVERLGDKGAVVLRFEQPELRDRWAKMREAGAKWDYPTYQPHVTITYDGGDVDLSKVKPYSGPLVFGPEIFEPVKDKWFDKVKLTGDADPERKLVRPPKGDDGLFVQPRDQGPEREAAEGANRDDFAQHFKFADPFVGDVRTFDSEGRYNCGRCNEVEGTTCMLVKLRKLSREAGSCKEWVAINDGQPELVTREMTVKEAGYGEAQNGVGFGCSRCPAGSKAFAADSQGRDLYCGKGDFRTFSNACCALNAAELVEGSDKNQPAPDEGATDSALRLALDRDTVRTFDRDGRLHVAVSNISKATVNPYRGKEIPGWEELGLDRDRIYNMLRDPEELRKAAPTFNGLPILRKHKATSADDHQTTDVIGSTGTDCDFDGTFLRNSLVFWPREAIDDIESGDKRELSSGYHYRPDMTAGNFDGKPYDGVMRDIVGNHVALVEDGRAGPDVVVGDSTEGLHMDNRTLAQKIDAISKRAATVGAIYAYLGPRMAMDAKPLGMADVFKDVTGKNFTAKKGDVLKALTERAKPLLAKDASIEELPKLLDTIEAHERKEGTDESVSTAQHNAMEAAAHGTGNLGIPSSVGKEFAQADKGKSFDKAVWDAVAGFLRGKGMSEDDITEVGKMMPKPATDENESEEERKKREEKAAADARAKDEAEKADKEKAAVDNKQAMDQAIKATAEATAKAVRETERGIRAALVEVQPWVGVLPATLAFDSAADVHRHALTMLGVENAKALHADALLPVLNVQPKPGDRRTEPAPLAMDAASSKDFAARFPGADRIGVVT